MTYRVGIAGCGIAGLSLALLLKRAGHAPVIYDQMDTPQPVGSGLMLQPTGLAVLKQLGLETRVKDYGQPIDRLFGLAGKRPILDVRYTALPGNIRGLGIHRAALFETLYEAVTAENIPVHFSQTVRSAGTDHFCFENRPDSPTFDLIVNGSGAHSPLKPRAKRLPYGALWATLDWDPSQGFDPFALEQRYQAARKMVGVLPVGHIPGLSGQKLTFFWSIKHKDVKAWKDAGLDPWKAEVAALWPQTATLLDQITSPDQLTLANYTHQTLTPPFTGRLVHVGDSFHAASPQLGQGANMALLDAWALAQALTNSTNIDTALSTYWKARRLHVHLYQTMTWAFTPVYQSDGRVIPWLRDYLIPPIAALPPFQTVLAGIVAGLIGQPLKRLGLTDIQQ